MMAGIPDEARDAVRASIMFELVAQLDELSRDTHEVIDAQSHGDGQVFDELAMWAERFRSSMRTTVMAAARLFDNDTVRCAAINGVATVWQVETAPDGVCAVVHVGHGGHGASTEIVDVELDWPSALRRAVDGALAEYEAETR